MISSSSTNFARLAGGACLAGGALLIATIPLGVGTPSTSAGLVGWGLAMALLMGGPLGLLALGAAGRRRLGTAGAALTLIGQAVQIAGMVHIALYPQLEGEQLFTPLGGQAMWIGMLLLGIACLREKRLTGWRRLAPLAVAVYFVGQLAAVQTPFYLSQGGEPNFALLSLWGLAWLVLGQALRSTAAERVEERRGGHEAARSMPA